MQNFHQGLDAITKQVLALVEEKLSPIILIDGRAGSGKSLFANALAERLYPELEAAPRVVHMDDLYPGWDGLQAGSHYLYQQILLPLKNGRKPSWQIWDWAKSQRGNEVEPGNGWREFSGGVPLIVDGCGSLSRVAKELCDLSVWIESDSKVRRQRLQERDGSTFDEFWPTWTIQEDEFYQLEKSKELADLVISN